MQRDQMRLVCRGQLGCGVETRGDGRRGIGIDQDILVGHGGFSFCGQVAATVAIRKV